MLTDTEKQFISSALAPSRQPRQVLRVLLDRMAPGQAEADAVPRLERRIAELLGKPAAAMFPSGTMAQQVAMRIHADRRGIRTVAFHPQCHLETHEHKGYAVVHGLAASLVGGPFSLIQLSDLEELREPIAALLLELPQRDIGGQLPSWADLVAQTGWAGERGAAVHMDGARLWEAQPFYDRSHAEIAALFDTVYVSLYKGLMGIAGAMLAGEQDLVDHARIWRDRLGGAVDRAWPMAALAERGLDVLLPRMAEFTARARELAAALTELPGVRVVPDPPQTPMFHLHVDAAPTAVSEASVWLAERGGLVPPRYTWPATSPWQSRFELNVSEQLDEVSNEQVVALFAELLDRARGQKS
ncbi:MAG: threonine aldolase family protein [Labedaea sp.]